MSPSYSDLNCPHILFFSSLFALVRLARSGKKSIVLLFCRSFPRSHVSFMPVASVFCVSWSTLIVLGSVVMLCANALFQSPLFPTMNIHMGVPLSWLVSMVASIMSMRL